MQFTNQTILITGGTSGIGLAMAKDLQARGNHVIIAGRRQALLDRILTDNPGMAGYALDVTDETAVATFAQTVLRDHPALSVLVNNAGVMLAETLAGDAITTDVLLPTITTNLLAPIRLIAALLPHLQGRSEAAIINVTSGLAYVPLAMTPTYNATKAALRSYTIALRMQLRHTAVKVIELAPPAVQTDLMPGSATNPHFLPLADFIAEAMDKLTAQPTPNEVLVDRVHVLRFAEATGNFDKVLRTLNQLD